MKARLERAEQRGSAVRAAPSLWVKVEVCFPSSVCRFTWAGGGEESQFHSSGAAAASSLPLVAWQHLEHRGMEQDPLERNVAAVTLGVTEQWRVRSWASSPIRMGQSAQQGENFLHPCKFGLCQTGLSEGCSCCILHLLYLRAPSAASGKSLKPHLGGSSASRIELVGTVLHTPHDFASSQDTAPEAGCLFRDKINVCA